MFISYHSFLLHALFTTVSYFMSKSDPYGNVGRRIQHLKLLFTSMDTILSFLSLASEPMTHYFSMIEKFTLVHVAYPCLVYLLTFP